MSTLPLTVAAAAGPSTPLNVSRIASQMFGLICTVSAGASLTYNVEVTADPSPSNSGNWNPHDVIVAQTGSVNGNIAYPVTGIRLNVTNYTSGTVTMGVAVRANQTSQQRVS